MDNTVDLALTPDGDLDFGVDDFKLASGIDFYKQCAINRIKSVTVDWFIDGIGADLEELIGMPNTQANAKAGEEKIMHALTGDDLFKPNEVSIKSSPIAKDRIRYEVTISKGDLGKVKLNVALDLVKGVTIGV